MSKLSEFIDRVNDHIENEAPVAKLLQWGCAVFVVGYLFGVYCS